MKNIISKLFIFGAIMLMSVAVFGQNKKVRGNYVGPNYAGKAVFIDTLGFTVVDSSAADIIQIDSVFQGAILQYDTTNGWESVNRAAVLGYKEYVALLTQSGTSAPVATVLYNDLGGAIVWTYLTTGDYEGTLTGAFVENKTATYRTSCPSVQGDDYGDIRVSRSSANVIALSTFSTGFSGADDILSGCTFTIRVYN